MGRMGREARERKRDEAIFWFTAVYCVRRDANQQVVCFFVNNNEPTKGERYPRV